MTSNFIKSFTISKLFIQSLPLYTSRLFTISSNAHTEDIEKPHRICSPCFFVDNFSGLFLHLLYFFNQIFKIGICISKKWYPNKL